MKSRRIIVIIFFLFFLQVQCVFAQEVSPTLTPSPTPSAYTLPYPGLLPGQPFYFLKNLRDKVIGFFISNPIKRAEYDLLQSDKKIQAAIFLLEKQRDTVVVDQTFIEAENSFSDAIEHGKAANQQGLGTEDLVKNLSVANLKYQEVLQDLIKGSSGKTTKMLTRHLQIILDLGEKVKKIDRK